MKKMIVFVLAAALAVFVGSWPGQADQVAWAAPVGHGGHGGFGHGGGRGGFGHGGGRGGHFEGGIWFGPGWWWDPFLYPYYPYYPYYTEPSVVVPQQSEEYLLPEPQPREAGYWYFCRDPKGYYPYVKRCPGGWLKVVPAPAPPGEEE